MPYHLTGDAIPFTEGADCWREAIQALQEQQSLNPIQWVSHLTTRHYESQIDTKNTGLAIVLSLFLDNGQEDRQNREIMQNPDVQFISVDGDTLKYCATGEEVEFDDAQMTYAPDDVDILDMIREYQ